MAVSDDLINRRLRELEKWRHTQETASAVDEVKRAHMDKRFDKIDEELGHIQSAFSKVLWAVILLVITATVKFILEGGLSAIPVAT